eukprot:gb/GEZJ01005381.1/.p1 GENE.gb/GEZJ01005381.1/~~gb/GEZJ01005381.1/.p1  ORF type:complete len:186 (-),score=24.03 gb/GEZJ01005381.1/:389-946(-)
MRREKAENRKIIRSSQKPKPPVTASTRRVAMPTTRSRATWANKVGIPPWKPKPDKQVTLLVTTPNGEKKVVGRAFVRGAVDATGRLTGDVVRELHGHKLVGKVKENLVVVWKVLIQDEKEMDYPYPFKTTATVSNRLGDMERNSFYCWDVNMMKLYGDEAATLPQTLSSTPSAPSAKKPSVKKVK